MRVSLLIDPSTARYLGVTVAALGHAGADVRVVPTHEIDAALVRDPGPAVVIGPGSPYHDPEAVYDVVRTCRERGVPLVGT